MLVRAVTGDGVLVWACAGAGVGGGVSGGALRGGGMLMSRG